MSEEYHHVLLNTSHHPNPDTKAEHDENYLQLFERYPPSRVLVFSNASTEHVHSGILSAAAVHGVDVQEYEIEGVTPPPNWTLEELATKPHRILENMIDGYNSSDFDRSKTVLTMVGGTTLHSSLFLILSRIIGSSIILNEGDQKEPDYRQQGWLSRVDQYTNLKSHEVKILDTILNSKSVPHFSRKSLLENDFWQPASAISGSDIHASKAKGFHNTVQSLINRGFIEKRGENPVQYRLSAKGWTSALTHTQIDTDDLTKIKARSSRITGFRLRRRNSQVPAIDIARTCSSTVEDWLTIMGSDGKTELKPGIDIFDDKDPSELGEEELEMHKEWRDFLDVLDMSEHSWCFFNTRGEQEKLFVQFCEWIWPRLTGGNPKRYWSLDLTQFTNKQIPFVSHFAFSTGIPMTWTSAPKGHYGIKTGDVKHNIENRRHRIYSVPNLDFSKCISGNSGTNLEVKTKFLIALLYQEEKYHADNAKRPVANPFSGEAVESKGELGAGRKALSIFVSEHPDSFVRDTLTFPNNSPTTRAYQKLIHEDLVRMETRGNEHHLTLSPLGRLVARILRDRLFSTVEEE